MAKPQKTVEELEELLKERCIALPIIAVTVFASLSNWDATFVAKPRGAPDLMPRFRQIVDDLRAEVDLKPE